MTDQELRDYLTGFMENETVDYVMGVVKQQQLAILDQVRMEEKSEADTADVWFNAAVAEFNQRIDKLQATLKGEQEHEKS